MSRTTIPDIIIENARIIFRNFSGKPSKYNKDGNRNFCLVIEDSDRAEKLREAGWNVRTLKPRDEEDEPVYYIQVSVSFKQIPPKIFLVTRKAKMPMDEETIGELDFAEIRNVDLTVRPYNWEVNDEKGVKAYLKNMYVTIEEDAFADKYANVADSSDEDDEDIPF